MKVYWRWYDLFVGVYYNVPGRLLYVVPIPTVVFCFQIPHKHDWVPGRGELDGKFFCAICGEEKESDNG